jgi:hypothetical protein
MEIVRFFVHIQVPVCRKFHMSPFLAVFICKYLSWILVPESYVHFLKFPYYSYV